MLSASEVVQIPVLTGSLVPPFREFSAGLLSFAYARIIVRVYANDCARMPKRLFMLARIHWTNPNLHPRWTQKSRKICTKIRKGHEMGHPWGYLFKGYAPEYCTHSQCITRKRGVGHTFFFFAYGRKLTFASAACLLIHAELAKVEYIDYKIDYETTSVYSLFIIL